MTKFNVGDKVKLVGKRKGEVTHVDSDGAIGARLFGLDWWFSSDEAKSVLKVVNDDLPLEPNVGSVVVDVDGDVYIRAELGWYMGAAQYNHAGFAWSWEGICGEFAPITVVYAHIETSED